MADVMAIISKAVFEKSAKHAKVGDVLPIDRYASTHKTLDALEGGGRLFLVTVRPPETLWLVAVLERPKLKQGAWVAAKNATAVRDLSSVQGKVKFVSGTGISAKKCALGMSLQTPRALTVDDAALLAGSSAPAPKAARTPAPALKKVMAPKSDLVHVERPFKTERERLEWLRDHGTVGHLAAERDLVNGAAPEHGAIIRAIDPVRLLLRQLRAGALEELTWPAQEQAADRLGSDVPDWRGVDECFRFFFCERRRWIASSSLAPTKSSPTRN